MMVIHGIVRLGEAKDVKEARKVLKANRLGDHEVKKSKAMKAYVATKKGCHCNTVLPSRL